MGPKDANRMTNNVEQDQTAPDLGLHCLPRPACPKSLLSTGFVFDEKSLYYRYHHQQLYVWYYVFSCCFLFIIIKLWTSVVLKSE